MGMNEKAAVNDVNSEHSRDWEQLAVLVAGGKAKEMIGVSLTQD